jgi:hypothetical protein
MSHLKDIIVELHNCLHEFEPEEEIPMVWSREFQQRLAQNANHWNDEQRRASHVSNMDFQDDVDAEIRIPYDDDYSELPDLPGLDPEVEFEQEEELSREFKTKWGTAFRKYLNSDSQEKEEMPFLKKMVKGEEEEVEICDSCGGVRQSVHHEDIPTSQLCDCDRNEEEEEFNITDDPEKVEKAKRLRDRAVEVRDKARAARDKAKAKQGGEDPDSFDDAVEGDDEWDDPDKQGVIRAIPNTHLVYKRQQEDGTFDELWHYNIGDDFKKELKIRRAILAGTDIPINRMKSPDGSQTYELWTVGNGQMLKIQGLPN